jgi:nucleoside phosphorylase
MEKREYVDVVVITALELERAAVLRHVDSSTRAGGEDSFYRAMVQARDTKYSLVVLSATGMGNVSAAAATVRAIDVWNPQHILLVGIAGGVKARGRRPGDVIVAEQIVGYEAGAMMDKGTVRRYQVLRPAHDLLQAARDLPTGAWRPSIPRPGDSRAIPRVHFGVVASGEKVIRSPRFVKSLSADWSRLAAVEMESFGVALAAYQAPTTPGMLMIKAISDWADPKKNDRWQEYAADTAASFAMALMRAGPMKSRAKASPAKRKTPYNGRNKIDLCRDLGPDWRILADYFDIPLDERDRFDRGWECQAIWEWLQRRGTLDGLPDGLRYIGREDLVKTLPPIP